MSDATFFYLLVIGLLSILNIGQTMEIISHRRYYYRKDLAELADIPYACRLLAEALEIETPGEKVDQYVSWAIKDRLAKDNSHE